MTTNEIIQNLQCFIDLTLFDATHGETINKDTLDKAAKTQVAACEEAIKLLSGASENTLAMPLKEISSTLTSLSAEFDNHIEEIKANGYAENNPVIPLEKSNSEAFKAVANKINTGKFKDDNIRNDR